MLMNGQSLQDQASTHRSSKEDIGQLLGQDADLQLGIIRLIIHFISKALDVAVILNKINVTSSGSKRLF
jgi:hypothetical protein